MKARPKLSAKPHMETQLSGGSDFGVLLLPEGVQLLRLKKGMESIKIDVLPYRVKSENRHLHNEMPQGSDLWYEREYYVHRNVGASRASVLCPYKMTGKPCPICEYRASLDWNDPEDRKNMQALAPQRRQLYNVVKVGDGLSEVFIFDQSWSIFGEQLANMITKADEEDEHYQYFADLEAGSTLKLNLQESSAGTFSFISIKSIEFKNRKEAYDETWLDKTVDLDGVFKPMLTYGAIKSLFFGTPVEEETEKKIEEGSQTVGGDASVEKSGDDNRATTPKSKEKPESKPTKAVEPDDSDADAVSAVKPKSKPAKSPVVDWDDDDF
jgi:hypothetical protein